MPYPSPLFASSAHAGDPCLAFAAIIVRKGTKAAVQRRPGEPHFSSTSVQNFRVGTLEGSQLRPVARLHTRSSHAWTRTLWTFSSSPSGGVWLISNRHSAPFTVDTPIVC